MAKAAISERLPEICADPTLLARYYVSLRESQLQALLELIQQAGVELVDCTADDPFLLLWNNRLDPSLTYHYSEQRPLAWDMNDRFVSESGILPRFRIVKPKALWRLRADYAGLLNVTFEQEA